MISKQQENSQAKERKVSSTEKLGSSFINPDL